MAADGAHAAIQPRPAAKPAQHRNGDGLRHRRPRDRTGVREVEQRRAGFLQQPRFVDELVLQLRGELRHGLRRPPYRMAVCGVMPNCAQTGKPAAAIARADSGNSAAASSFSMSARLRHQVLRRLRRGNRPFLQRPVGHVAADQRAIDAAPHALADEQHLVERDLELAALPPHVGADRIADRDDVDAGAVDDLRHLVVVDDDGDDFSAFALHRLKRGDRHPVAHRNTGRTSAGRRGSSRRPRDDHQRPGPHLRQRLGQRSRRWPTVRARRPSRS